MNVVASISSKRLAIQVTWSRVSFESSSGKCLYRFRDSLAKWTLADEDDDDDDDMDDYDDVEVL